jgi:hypothetical protein
MVKMEFTPIADIPEEPEDFFAMDVLEGDEEVTESMADYWTRSRR